MVRSEVSPFMHHDAKGKNHSYYLKLPAEGHYIRRPDIEWRGYQLLKPYFRLPQARLAYTEQGPILVVREVKALSGNKHLVTDPEWVAQTLDAFIEDNYKMWSSTSLGMNEHEVSRDWRDTTLKMLRRLVHNPKVQELLDKPFVVNGERYPTLGDTLLQCQRRLAAGPERMMCLCHGDEHLENVLLDPEGYWVIDPGNYTGFNSPSSAVNNLVGANYLFLYRYDHRIRHLHNSFRVDYQVRPPYQAAEQLLRPVFRKVDQMVNELQGQESLSKEYLFINELRVAVGLVQRKMDLTDILSAGMMYAGLAVEHYYNDDIV